jgi:hypothetical protein
LPSASSDITRRILLPFCLAWILGVAGIYVGALLTPDGSGLAGPAVALSYGVAGVISGAVVGIAAAWRMTERRLQPIFTAVMTAALLIFVVLGVAVIYQLRQAA